MRSCEVCLDLDRCTITESGKPRWDDAIKDDLSPEHSLEFDLSQLEMSAKSGCHICAVVWNGWGLMGQKSLVDQPQPRRGRFILQVNCPLEVEIFDVCSPEKKPVPFARLQFYTLAGTDSKSPKWCAFSAAKDVPAEISVESSSSIILEWITNCEKTHPRCAKKIEQAAAFPLRLLNIKPRIDADVRVVDSRDISLGPRIQYATLSHCWGKERVIQTTKETLGRRKQGIEWNSLPKTFQDAVTIVRSLGILFIWIDSLCIVQDDENEWKHESARMAAIYSNSYLNVAATGASDSRGGCLSPRALSHVSRRFEIHSVPVNFLADPAEPAESAKPAIFVRPSFDPIHHRYSTSQRYQSDLPDSKVVPLLSRAWVFQERFLAPRTVHFHPSEMVMECKSGLCCECTGLDKCLARPRKKSSAFQSFDDNEILDAWIEVVEEFSRLRLTRETDRLPALIGVATVFQAYLKTEYLAGLWRKDLARGLLWDVTRTVSLLSTGFDPCHRRPFVPTWTWASLILNEDAGIIFPAAHEDTFEVDQRFEYLKTDMPVIATETNFGALNGKLWVRGAFITALFCLRQSRISPRDSIIIFDHDIDDTVLVCTSEMNVDIDALTSDSRHWTNETTMMTICCLLVGKWVEDDWDTGQQTRYQCSLVLRCCSTARDTFERLGIIDINEDLNLFHSSAEKFFELI